MEVKTVCVAAGLTGLVSFSTPPFRAWQHKCCCCLWSVSHGGPKFSQWLSNKRRWGSIWAVMPQIVHVLNVGGGHGMQGNIHPRSLMCPVESDIDISNGGFRQSAGAKA